MPHVIRRYRISVQDSPEHLLLRADESGNEAASGNSECKASSDIYEEVK
jgi:hypothetical protein